MSNKKYLGVHGHKELVREADTKALINIDNESLNKYKEERENLRKLSKVLNEHDEMKSDILEIKNILIALLERKKE